MGVKNLVSGINKDRISKLEDGIEEFYKIVEIKVDKRIIKRDRGRDYVY